jgi:hypothetical protein
VEHSAPHEDEAQLKPAAREEVGETLDGVPRERGLGDGPALDVRQLPRLVEHRWLTALPVSRKTVEEIAQKGGRQRWKVENEGFNRQKNSGLNLEHVYSTDPENWKVYYLLLPIAFLLVQLLERGSLLRRLAAEAGRPVWKLFGSLKNVARRLLDSVRYVTWEESWFDPALAAKLRIEWDSS